MSIELVAWIIIPLIVFMLGAAFGGIKMAIRFAQHLTRSEAVQSSTAKSAEAIVDRLDRYIQINDQRVNTLAADVQVLKYAISRNRRNHD